jgi:hypothetical protein
MVLVLDTLKRALQRLDALLVRGKLFGREVGDEQM